MDRMAAALDATSLEDLVALALAQGVHLEVGSICSVFFPEVLYCK